MECGTHISSVEEVQPSFTKTLDSPAYVVTPGIVFANRYEILDKIGEGGMGEVYRALDKNLDRQVAIKILPAAFAEDKERLARFDREAKLLAALSHTNIAAIYGLEETGGRRFLVLELVEGESLKAKLDSGSMEVEEALSLCRQVAEGLEAAHEKGITHRDLKPGNIMVTPEGNAKILDFGLAKAFTGETTGIDIEKSPTITAQMTKPGVIMGTAAYMSPEQARGRSADKRADIWAFGCVLFECLTGRRAFQGDTVSDLLAHILKGEPDWSELPEDTPASIRTLLRRCLQKDKKNRLHDIADARIEIDEAGSLAAEKGSATRRFPLRWIIAVGAVLFIMGFLLRPLIWKMHESGPAAYPVASVIKLEPGYSLDGERSALEFNWPSRTSMALSQDGQFIVYCAVNDASDEEEKPQLFIRRLENLDASPIQGTTGGIAPFLSPDDRWIGFWADGKLKKVPTEGGIAQDLCESDNLGASWGFNDLIVFASNSNGGLSIVPASLGMPEVLTVPDKSRGESAHKLPSYLPDTQAILFTVKQRSPEPNHRIALFKSKNREWEYLIDDGADARYVPSGHIVFMRQGMLMAVPFDLSDFRIVGQAVRIRPNIIHNLKPSALGTSAGQYNISQSGCLIYTPGGIIPEWNNSWAWVDQKGKDEPASSRLENFYMPKISPDGQKFVYAMFSEDKDIWVCDTVRDISYPVTTDDVCWSPLWTPDGKRIIYGKRQSDQSIGIFSRSADGSEDTEELIVSFPQGNFFLSSISQDGARLAFVEVLENNDDIYIYDFQSKDITPFKKTIYNECDPSFSPDGRWLIYASDKEGRFEVYVSRSSGSGGEIKVSREGGREPGWARSGKQIFYRADDSQQMWVVDFHAGMDLPIGTSRLLFQSPNFGGTGHVRCWDISLDDQRFLMVKRERFPLKPVTEMIFVQNWFEELKRLVPTGK